MKRALLLLTAVVLMGLMGTLWLLQGAYTYSYSETNPVPGSNWTTQTASHWNGLITTTETAMIGTGSSGNGHEIKMSFSFQSANGTTRVYFNAQDPLDPDVSPLSGSPTGPRYWEVAFGGNGWLWVNAVYPDSPNYWGGPYTTTHTTVASTTYNPSGTVTARVVKKSGIIYVWINNVLVQVANLPTPHWSNLGPNYYRPWGIAYDPGLSSISQIDVGALDYTAPNPISPANITKISTYSTITLQWPTATDDANGIGVGRYEIYRNGSLIGTTSGLSFMDSAVSPGTTYTYELRVVDYHLNSASGGTFSVATDTTGTNPAITQNSPSSTPEGRRVGVRATGAYWGAGSENIDVMSGNLSFALPAVGVQSRAGWGASFALSYNSQSWRWDGPAAANWLYGRDVGYGFGWKLMAGSITPLYQDAYTISAYIFTDSSGAEYRLDSNVNGEWTSKESLYVYFVPGVNKLYFRDGSFWQFGCTSYSNQPDQGVMYPTLMQDSNGNQVNIRYQTAPGAPWADSTARIKEIEDTRAVNSTYTYAFNYNNDSTPHLTSITGHSSIFQNTSILSLTYSQNQPLASPFNSQVMANTTHLQQVISAVDNRFHQFTFNGSGEMIQIDLPTGGKLSYDYVTATYPGGTKHREIQNRRLYKDVGSSANALYTFTHETSPGTSVHQWTDITDPGGYGRKHWEFGQSGVNWGLVTNYKGYHLNGVTADVRVQNDYTWSQHSGDLNSYISEVLTTKDPGQSYVVASKSTQAIDSYGNVTSASIYDYNSLTTPKRTDTYTYLTNTNYTSLHIFNRLLTGPKLSISYDTSSRGGTDSPKLWDASVSTFRGNPTYVNSNGTETSTYYSNLGQALSRSVNGVVTSVTMDAARSYAVPTQISVGGTTNFDQSFSFNNALQPTSTTNANSATTSAGYDSFGRPNSATSPYGATSSVTYGNTNPKVDTTSLNGRWTKTTADGLGRPVKVESGYGTTTVSVVDTVYGPCGCTPTGKMMQTSLPHGPSENPVWTTNVYDGIGRTLMTTTVGSDTTSTTTYVYEGNTVKVTDATNKWKKYTTNILGQITQVNEPNPVSGQPDYVTTYTYDTDGHLTGVSMPRPTGTQTRTFVYDTNGLMTSQTNPETGTKTYAYNSDKTLQSMTDAKSQQTQYSYDSYKRVTQIRRGMNTGSFSEDLCQREDYFYDTNTFDTSYTQYGKGRLIAVQYQGGASSGDYWATCDTTFTEMYSYNPSGATTKKRLRFTRQQPGGGFPSSFDLDSSYTYDNEGRNTGIQYPGGWSGGGYGSWTAGPNRGIEVDEMGRLKKLKDLTAATDIISGTTYNAMGELLTMANAVTGLTETRSYNSIGQMKQLQIANVYGQSSINLQYNFSSTQNNGKIQSETDVLSGETVTYTYDSLNRLASATSSVNPGWGQSYGYDGFGNLTNVNVTKGTAPTLGVTYNAATNRRTSDCADANGNISPCGSPYAYDVANRITRADQGVRYSYAPNNQRIWRGLWSGSTTRTVDEITVYSAGGAKLASYDVVAVGFEWRAVSTGYYEYFGGKLLKNAQGWVNQDRLGSIGKYFPYGEERPSATANGKEKFATYTRDAETGLDYAQNRYHSAGQGRFLTADPYGGSAAAENPGSWNRYAYVGGDPVNHSDRTGLEWECVGWGETWYCEEYASREDIWLINYLRQSNWGNTCPMCISIQDPAPQLNTSCAAEYEWVDEIVGCIPTQTAGGSAPTSVSNVQSFAQNPWSGVASAIQGTKCESWLQGGLDKSDFKGQTINNFLTDPNQLAGVTGIATFADGTAQAVYGNVLAPGYLILIRDGGFYSNAMAGYGLPSNNYVQQIGGINGGTDRAKSFLLIHELAHALGLIKPDGDAKNANNSAANNDAIWFNCGKELTGFKNR